MKQVPALKIDGITIGQSVSAGFGRPLVGAVPRMRGLPSMINVWWREEYGCLLWEVKGDLSIWRTSSAG